MDWAVVTTKGEVAVTAPLFHEDTTWQDAP